MLKQITVQEAVLAINTQYPDYDNLKLNIIFSIKRKLKGKVLFTYKIPIEDSNGRKIIGVDTFRVYLKGRNNSYKLEDLSLEDALTIFSDISKH